MHARLSPPLWLRGAVSLAWCGGGHDVTPVNEASHHGCPRWLEMSADRECTRYKILFNEAQPRRLGKRTGTIVSPLPPGSSGLPQNLAGCCWRVHPRGAWRVVVDHWHADVIAALVNSRHSLGLCGLDRGLACGLSRCVRAERVAILLHDKQAVFGRIVQPYQYGLFCRCHRSAPLSWGLSCVASDRYILADKIFCVKHNCKNYLCPRNSGTESGRESRRQRWICAGFRYTILRPNA